MEFGIEIMDQSELSYDSTPLERITFVWDNSIAGYESTSYKIRNFILPPTSIDIGHERE